jgi:hypothetical protein
MSTIEGIDKAIAVLTPHWDEIQADFDRQNTRFLALATADHDAIGRVLRSHLVIENFMNSYLSEFYGISNFDEVRLSFYQKATLLPLQGSPAAFVRSGILQLNALRNKFGHRLQPQINPAEIEAIYSVLQISGRKVEDLAPVAAIETFTPVACTFLSVSTKRLQQLFAEAFSHVRLAPLDGDN